MTPTIDPIAFDEMLRRSLPVEAQANFTAPNHPTGTEVVTDTVDFEDEDFRKEVLEAARRRIQEIFREHGLSAVGVKIIDKGVRGTVELTGEKELVRKAKALLAD